MNQRNKIYFASDFHLGIPSFAESLEREKRIIRWLNSIQHDAAKLFLVGDLFDFWFEYKHVAPKGFVRLLGKLAELKDNGVDVQIFTGNHDMWMFGYFEKELNIPVHRNPIEFQFEGKCFYIGHGDGIGPKDHGFKVLKKIFNSKFCQFLFSLLHPTVAFNIANFFSYRSRTANVESPFLGEENEWQIIFAKEKLVHHHIDYFIFGHRHIALNIEIAPNSTFINLGDWITLNSYAKFDGITTQLLYFEK